MLHCNFVRAPDCRVTPPIVLSNTDCIDAEWPSCATCWGFGKRRFADSSRIFEVTRKRYMGVGDGDRDGHGDG